MPGGAEAENGVYLGIFNRSEDARPYSADCSAAGLDVKTGIVAPLSGEILRLA